MLANLINDIRAITNQINSMVEHRAEEPGVMYYDTLEGEKMRCVLLHRDRHSESFLCYQPKHTTIASHSHANSVEVFHVYKGAIRLRDKRLRQGEAMIIPANKSHGPITAEDDAVYLTSLCPPEVAYKAVNQ
jgi:quercetin dioxygenase-like cupin family protein